MLSKNQDTFQIQDSIETAEYTLEVSSDSKVFENHKRRNQSYKPNQTEYKIRKEEITTGESMVKQEMEKNSLFRNWQVFSER
ncbi:MAG: hypothetical protein IPL26_09285 [Leptospiraceae bacterium]|nr:hypothetical protein [Leptospiraceae bacterium]